MRGSGVRLAALFVLGAYLLAACTGSVAPPATPPQNRPTLPGQGAALTPGPVVQANSDIARDFLRLVYFRESGLELPGLLRFEAPVRVALSGRGLSAYAADLDALIARMRREAGIDIARVGRVSEANILIAVAPRARLREVFPGAQCFVSPRKLSWQRFRAALGAGTLPGWDALEALTEAAIYIPDDASPQDVRDCLEEELAQTLGPANDLFELSQSVFNDDNVHNRLTRFDMLVLRLLYDPALKSGMGRAEAARTVRRLLASANPAGQRVAPRPGLRPSSEWDAILRGLFRSNAPRPAQRASLRRGLRLAQSFPQPDHRLATTLDLLAALEFGARPELSEGLLERALTSLERWGAPQDLRQATIRVYLAATKQALGKSAEVLPLIETALPVLAAHDAAARIDQALSLRTQALQSLGRSEDAAQSAIDSRAWSAYVRGTPAGRLLRFSP
ncbi:MAG: DUF2927 domain-containing protein [Pseudomonadota bacterium]